MTPRHYYNEWDTKTAAWLRELIADGQLPQGDVDERSITDVQPADLAEYTQCHFFAGIAGWPLALQLAGWPATRPVWTGSCPCQPFSAAGKGLGTADERHLWPEFLRLIAQCAPPVVFGEQVASRAGREWLSGVRADLETVGYAVGAADLCAAGVGAPHIRQRLFWLAHSEATQWGWGRGAHNSRWRDAETGGSGIACGLADSESTGSPSRGTRGVLAELGECGASRGLRDTESVGRTGWTHDHNGGRRELTPGCAGEASTDRLQHPSGDGRDERRAEPVGRSIASGCGDGACGLPHASCARSQEFSGGRDEPARSAAPGFWSDFTVLPFRGGKQRRVEPGTFPLVDGLPRGVVHSGDIRPQATAEARVMRLKGYGNAINPHIAAAFVTAFNEARATA